MRGILGDIFVRHIVDDLQLLLVSLRAISSTWLLSRGKEEVSPRDLAGGSQKSTTFESTKR